MSLLKKFPLLSAEELENTPSRRDGVPASMEHRRRKQTAQHLKAVSATFHMSITTWAIAVTFFNRFYARKSLKKNNSFVIACASLFLAGKVNDKPRPHSRLTNEIIKAWYGKDNPQLHQLKNQPQFWEQLYDAVLEAERALLHTVGFDFNIDTLHPQVVKLLNRPRFVALGLKKNVDFTQTVINLVNDLYVKDGMLMLQYPMHKVAVAMLYVVFKRAKALGIKQIPQPPPTPEGELPWYVEEGLSVEECQTITTRLVDRLWGDPAATRTAAGPGHGNPRPTTTMGAASTAMLGGCESAAYSGAGTVGGTPASELMSCADGQGEHTSVPRPLGSDMYSGTTRRPAAAGAASDADHPAKRARHEELAVGGTPNEVTSGPAHLPQNGHAARSPLPSPAAPAPAAKPSAPPAAAAAPAEDSEKEEGELEEGELQ